MIRRVSLAAIGAACVSFVAAAPAHGAPATALLETTSAAGTDDCPKAAALATVVNDGHRAPRVDARRSRRGGAAGARPGAFRTRWEGIHGDRERRRRARRDAKAHRRRAPMRHARQRGRRPAGPAARLGRRNPGRWRGGDGPCRGCVAASSSAARAGHATTADLAVGGGVAEGLVGGWSPTIGLGGTLAHDRWSARLGGVWLPEKAYDYGPGRVQVGLAFARLALCGSTRVEGSNVTMGLCAQQQVGWLRGRGSGYDVANHERRSAVAGRRRGGRRERTFRPIVRVGGGGGRVRLLRQHRFVVDNLGTGFQSDPWAVHDDARLHDEALVMRARVAIVVLLVALGAAPACAPDESSVGAVNQVDGGARDGRVPWRWWRFRRLDFQNMQALERSGAIGGDRRGGLARWRRRGRRLVGTGSVLGYAWPIPFDDGSPRRLAPIGERLVGVDAAGAVWTTIVSEDAKGHPPTMFACRRPMVRRRCCCRPISPPTSALINQWPTAWCRSAHRHRISRCRGPSVGIRGRATAAVRAVAGLPTAMASPII